MVGGAKLYEENTTDKGFKFHPGKIFDVDISRKVEYGEDFETNICQQPREIWLLIMSYLDDRSWLAIRQTCKFFYFLEPDKYIES